MYAQRLQFCEIEVDDVPLAIITTPVREAVRHVRDFLENQVMKDDGHIVPGEHDVLLEVVGTGGVRVSLGDQRVFREIARRAAVGDDDRGFAIRDGGTHTGEG